MIWFQINKDSVPQRTPTDLIDYTPKVAEQDYLPTRPVGGTYFPADETRTVMRWAYPAGAQSRAAWTAFDSAKEQLAVKACFCSVLGECWTSQLKADLPQPVESCALPRHVDFKER